MRAHLSGQTALAKSWVEVSGKSYRLLHPDSAESLIDEEDFERDERLPYWAEIWPSAVALARYLSSLDIEGRKTVELGCGIGLPSLVALDRGARVMATDYYEAALKFARQNAEINTALELPTAHLDWHSPQKGSLGKFDLVIAADVLYEQRNVPALAALIPDLLGSGGEALISDPRRKNTPRFLEIMEEHGFSCSAQSRTVRQGDKDIEVSIHRLRRVP